MIRILHGCRKTLSTRFFQTLALVAICVATLPTARAESPERSEDVSPVTDELLSRIELHIKDLKFSREPSHHPLAAPLFNVTEWDHIQDGDTTWILPWRPPSTRIHRIDLSRMRCMFQISGGGEVANPEALIGSSGQVTSAHYEAQDVNGDGKVYDISLAILFELSPNPSGARQAGVLCTRTHHGTSQIPLAELRDALGATHFDLLLKDPPKPTVVTCSKTKTITKRGIPTTGFSPVNDDGSTSIALANAQFSLKKLCEKDTQVGSPKVTVTCDSWMGGHSPGMGNEGTLLCTGSCTETVPDCPAGTQFVPPSTPSPTGLYISGKAEDMREAFDTREEKESHATNPGGHTGDRARPEEQKAL